MGLRATLTLETTIDVFRDSRGRGLRIAPICGVVAVTAALHSILTAFALVPDSV